MTIRIVIGDDGTVDLIDIEDEEIDEILGSGFFAAVLRQNDDGIVEYADVNWDEYRIDWKKPEIRVYK